MEHMGYEPTTREEHIMAGRITPGLRQLRKGEVTFILANRPGCVYIGREEDMNDYMSEQPHRIPVRRALAYLQEGAREAREKADPSLLWDTRDLYPTPPTRTQQGQRVLKLLEEVAA